ncbi:hypothetical protein HK44_020410 [Pseudomonas fluorescens HK44]|uniref:Uncharacterized protein n=1 Tax=Pseudomonas fluorescens HK44 TaxID=1042209 RepID=A0A010RTZ6_PSEFL|nr:hypothetical protein [Pseudomonas fluorescens]EXF95766.1 hypothetical protein HK44_020410 [Pseudomonas fluorescens HK44]
MSPHIAIDRALEALELPEATDLDETLTEGLIVRHFTASDITAEEFHHYSAKLLKISRQRKELSACSR